MARRRLAISREDVYAALENAAGGPVAEGCVGGGTGMHVFGFKGGIGTASRLVPVAERQYTVGALVMTNFGERRELRIAGVPVGRLLGEESRLGPGPYRFDGQRWER
jgi:D-aminopeptidase